MTVLLPGESVFVSGSKGNTYVITNNDGDYSCTCPAWAHQKRPPSQRTCKHITSLLDGTAAAVRIETPENPMAHVPLSRLIKQPWEVAQEIERLTECGRLWVDTETCRHSGLSLLQVLADNAAATVREVLLFDVLNQPELTSLFVNRIMHDASIEKVFHNASFDVSRLGGNEARNVSCTFRSAQDLRRRGCALLPEILSLKSLAEHFDVAKHVCKEEQSSDWGRRPLADRQLKYAALDVVLLRGVHLRLLDIDQGMSNQ